MEAILVLVHSRVKGRARFKVRGVASLDGLDEYLFARLASHEAVIDLNINQVTQNLLVIYKTSVELLILKELINGYIAEWKDGRPVSRSRKSSGKSLSRPKDGRKGIQDLDETGVDSCSCTGKSRQIWS